MGLAATLVGLPLVYLAPGTFGLASAFPQSQDCTDLSAPPPGIRPPAGLSPNLIRHCSKSFFGFPFRNEIALVEEREIGMLTAERVVTTRRSVTYVVGPDLRPVDAFDLDSILSLAYLAYVVTAQGLYGATVGKRLLRLRVVDRYGVRPGLGAAAIRNLVLNGPILVGLALYALMEWTSFGSLTLLARRRARAVQPRHRGRGLAHRAQGQAEPPRQARRNPRRPPAAPSGSARWVSAGKRPAPR
jgi:hypothetical protein